MSTKNHSFKNTRPLRMFPHEKMLILIFIFKYKVFDL